MKHTQRRRHKHPWGGYSRKLGKSSLLRFGWRRGPAELKWPYVLFFRSCCSNNDLVKDAVVTCGLDFFECSCNFDLLPYSCDVSVATYVCCLLYTSPSPRDGLLSRMPS